MWEKTISIKTCDILMNFLWVQNIVDDEFKNQWCDHIVTHTDNENILSQNFYKNNGLKPVTIELWKAI